MKKFQTQKGLNTEVWKDTVSTHYEINKVGNNLVFQRKDKASYLVESKSVEIKEENEKEYIFLVDNKIYKINKEDVQ